MSLRPARMIYPDRGSVRETPPAIEPVTADELRANLVLESAQLGDTEAESLIAVAREYIEETTGIAMITQGWRLSLNEWPYGREPWWDGVRQGAISDLRSGRAVVALPVYPLQSVDTVTVFNEASVPSVVNIGATFDIDTYQKPGRLALQDGATWPVALRNINAIQIEYTAGYGLTAGTVPAPLRRAVLQMASYLYEHRGDGCAVGDAYRDSGAESMAMRYKVVRI
jgi:hypothetical protein